MPWRPTTASSTARSSRFRVQNRSLFTRSRQRGHVDSRFDDIVEAKQLTATDPVTASGEMVAEYHELKGLVALMQVTETHNRITKPGS